MSITDEPTRTPSQHKMASTFDRLVESNLELIGTVRYAIAVLIGLTFLALAVSIYSIRTSVKNQRDLQDMVSTILKEGHK